MKKAIKALFLSASLAAFASASGAATLGDDDRALIVKEVVEHFKKNPQELVEAIVGWREAAAQEKVVALPQPVSGNRNGELVIFEFMDYGCEPCVSNARVVDEVAAQDGNIAVVHYDLPTSSKESVSASLEIIAAGSISPEWQKLRNLYLKEGVGAETRLKALDVINLKPSNLDLRGAMQTIRENKETAKMVGVTKPSAVVISYNDLYYPFTGGLTAEMLKSEIDKIRGQK